jgi:hypothetical protein
MWLSQHITVVERKNGRENIDDYDSIGNKFKRQMPALTTPAADQTCRI